MMNIREMRVSVRDWCMAMRVGVRLVAIPCKVMFVLMMRVVAMTMRVVQRVMSVRMFMTFADVQPHTQRHQRGGDPEERRRQLRPQQP